MKIQKVSLAIISLIILTSCSSNKNLVAAEKISNNVIKQPLANQNEAIDISSQVTSKDILSETVNEIKVEITSAKVISTGVEIGVCYTAPDNGEWRPMPGHLFYGEYEVYPDEIQFLEGEIIAGGKNTGTRCALIRYRIENLNALVTPIKFSIVQFYAAGREMYTPCQEFQQKLDSNPKARAHSLKANCMETGDGNISVTLVEHDKSMTRDQASKTLDEIAEGEVIGLWEFMIDEIER